MKAVRIPTSGPIDVIQLAQPTGDDARALLTQLYSIIGCDIVECIRLTDTMDAWLNETGRADGEPLNPRATALAGAHGVDQPLYGDVIVLGAEQNTGESVGLTDDQHRQITLPLLVEGHSS